MCRAHYDATRKIGIQEIVPIFMDNSNGMCPPEWQNRPHITHQDVLDKLEELATIA